MNAQEDRDLQEYILIAEDEPINFMLLEKMLEKTPYTILWAKNGKEAISKVRANPRICLVLMDIRMPEMDGIQATAEIHREFPTLPVVAVTAYTLSNERERCMDAGASAFLNKPVNPAELMQALTLARVL